MRDAECVAFLRWALPRLRMRWPGFRRVRGQVCKRLARRVRALGLADLQAYRQRLEAAPEDDPEWGALDACCRITVSRFLRDRAVWDALARRVLPTLAVRARSEGRPLRAWSAGCGGGEEPYGLRALFDLELAPMHPGLGLEVLATDVDPASLDRARRGCYGGSSLREVPEAWRERVFEWRAGLAPATAGTPEAACWCVRAPFRAGIVFAEQDLRRTLPDDAFDLVLCRNLAFTYFDAALQTEVLERIAARLVPGGALVVGLHERPPAVPGLSPWPDARAVFRWRGGPAPGSALEVEWRASEAGTPAPVSFGVPGAVRAVTEVVDRWPGEGYVYFRVRTADGAAWILRHDTDRDRWTLHAFEGRRG